MAFYSVWIWLQKFLITHDLSELWTVHQWDSTNVVKSAWLKPKSFQISQLTISDNRIKVLQYVYDKLYALHKNTKNMINDFVNCPCTLSHLDNAVVAMISLASEALLEGSALSWRDISANPNRFLAIMVYVPIWSIRWWGLPLLSFLLISCANIPTSVQSLAFLATFDEVGQLWRLRPLSKLCCPGFKSSPNGVSKMILSTGGLAQIWAVTFFSVGVKSINLRVPLVNWISGCP